MTTLHDSHPATIDSSGSAAPRQARTVRPAVNAKLVAAAVGIIALCTAGSAALFGMVSGTSPLVVAATPVAKGEIISDSDLTTAAVATDPSVASVTADQLAGLVGQRAAVDLPTGALLTPDSVTDEPVPGPGRALVGVSVTSAQAPLTDLAPGTPVRLAHVQAGADPTDPATAPSAPVPAVVVSTGTAPDGARVIDVTVTAAAAPTVSDWAASGEVAVIVDTVAR